MKKISEVVIYKSKKGKIKLEVNLQEETVWLSLNQLAQLFGRDKSVVSRHLSNIYKTKELYKKSTVAKIATVQNEGDREIARNIEYYNLDAIISVGYRVNSKRGTQFRIWATDILKKHLIEGYTVNEKCLKRDEQKLRALEKTIKVIDTVIERKKLSQDEATGFLKLLSDYNHALDILDDFDNRNLKIKHTTKKEASKIEYGESKDVIEKMRKKFKASDLFGTEKDKSFRSSLKAIYQSFDEKDLYPSIEEKAANLLYLIVKNHSFIDGNKRIAATLFIWFLERNGILYRNNGTKRIEDNALVAITLMIAESKPSEHKDMVLLVVNLINKNN